MKETALFGKLRPHLASWGEYDRVENSIGSGMSDVFYNIGGTLGWIETKVAKGDYIYFEKFQPNWISKHARLGARMFIMVLDKQETIHLFRASVVLKAPRHAYEKWILVNMNDVPRGFSMPPPYRSWKSIKEILTS